MKIYLCSSCNKTIPLSELAEHRKTCGPDAELSLKTGIGTKLGKVFSSIFLFVLLLALSGAAMLLGKGSFKSIAQMRALERVPATEVHAVLPGEVNLTGTAEKLQAILQSPKTGSDCLYYKYVVEKRTRDSDGDTKWETVINEERFVDFLLKDSTGSIVVKPSDSVDFGVNESYSHQEGDMRYTEYRIDPGDSVFLFGWASVKGRSAEVRFDVPGRYTPIISERGEERERTGMAGLSVGLCWGGLVCLAFAVGLAASLIRLHRLLVYFLILSTVVAAYLCTLGLQMMKSDLQSGAARLASHAEMAKAAVTAATGRTSDWEQLGELGGVRGLSAAEAKRLSRIRLDLAVAVRRFQMQYSSFPERILAPRWGIAKPADLPLPDSQKEDFLRLVSGFHKAAVPPLVGWIIIGLSFAVGAGMAKAGIRKVKTKRCIENLPTSKTAGAAYGLCELKGIIELPDGAEPLAGPLTGLPCVQYRYIVKERRRSGKKTTWVTIVDEKRSRPFRCTDSEGSMTIDPSGATVYTEHSSSKSAGKLHYTETRLELNDPLYALGECSIDEGRGDALMMKKPYADYPFILSNMTENRVMRKVAATGIALLNVAFSAFLLTALVLFGLSGSFAATDYLASALVTPFFMAFVILALHYNDLVFLRERAERNWSNIDVSLKKRHDLIPSLEQAVKGYMAHESGLLQAITEMRSSYETTGARSPESVGKFMEAEHRAASQLLGLIESYPDLKANQVFSLLMAKIIGMENEISFMRMGYNQAVETYNTRTSTIPDVIFAKLFGFREKSFISAETEIVRMPVSVSDMNRQSQAPQNQPPPPAPPTAPAAAQPPPVPAMTAPTEQQLKDAADGKAVIYALLLNREDDVSKAQLEAIAKAEGEELRARTAGLIEAVAKQVTDPVNRLRTAEEWLPRLCALKPSEYDVFAQIVRSLIEQDKDISLFEYALSKSIDRRLQPHFSNAEPAPARYKDMSLITGHVSLLLSRLAQAEQVPADTALAAFNEGVSALNHASKADFRLKPPEACTLAAFDAALDEVALASVEVKRNVLDACTKLVVMGGDYTWDQAMLTAAAADVFGLQRPEWM